MARRSRRRRAPSASTANPRSYSGLHTRAAHGRSENPEPSSRQQQATPEQTPVQATSLRGSDQINWHAEYNQIFSDLKQLLIVSGVLFALMLVLGFVL